MVDTESLLQALQAFNGKVGKHVIQHHPAACTVLNKLDFSQNIEFQQIPEIGCTNFEDDFFIFPDEKSKLSKIVIITIYHRKIISKSNCVQLFGS